MADIDVERKSPMTWIWLLLALVVLGLLMIWLLADPARDQVAVVDQPAMEPAPPAAPVDPAPVAAARVEEYRQQCAPREPMEMGLDHQYTASCLLNLVAAMEESIPAERLTAVQGELAGARDAAQRLEQSPPDALDHSAMARDGFRSVATAFEHIQQQWHPQLAQPVQQLSRTAEAVDPGEPLLEQRSEIQAFFARAGDALDQVSGTGVGTGAGAGTGAGTAAGTTGY